MVFLQSTWDSTEIIKIVIGVLTPLALLFLGIWVNRIAKRVEATQWANQKLIEKRIAIYDDLAPLVNDLYCYYSGVGNYKEFSPADVIGIKRKMDKKVYVYASLFSSEFLGIYREFINSYFIPFGGERGEDAKLRTSIEHPVGGNRRKVSAFTWKPEWDELFCSEKERSSLERIKRSYDNLMSRFAAELGVGLGRPEKTIR